MSLVSTFRKILASLMVIMMPFVSLADDDIWDDGNDWERPEYEGTLLVEPIITGVSFEQNKQGKDFLMIIAGNNLEQYSGYSTMNIIVPGPEGGTIDVGGDNIEYISDYKIITRLHEDMRGGEMYIKITHDNETIESKPFFLDIVNPEIYFIYSKNGLLPGEKIEIYGKNFLEDSFKTELNLDIALEQYQIEDNVISFELPNLKFEGDVQVIRNGLKSNKLNLDKLFPPIIQSYSVQKMSEDENDVIKIVGQNIPQDTSSVKVLFDDKSATPSNIFLNNAGKTVVEAPMCKPLSTISTIRVEVDGVKSNGFIHETQNLPEVTNAEYIGIGSEGQSFDIYCFNLPDNDADFELKIDGRTIGDGEMNRFCNRINVVTKDYVDDTGEITITNYGKYVSKVFEYDFSDNLKPFIYRVESKYGFHEGVNFSVFGSNFGYSSRAIDLNISGASLDTDVGFEGVTLKSDRVEAVFALPGKANSVEIAPEPTKNISVQVNANNIDSNMVLVPWGSDHPTVVFAPPIIQRVEFPNGRNIGKKMIVRGKNFSTSLKQNTFEIGSIEFPATAVGARGNKLEAIIPEGAKSGNLILHRTYPDDQKSNAFAIKISPSDKSNIEFQFLENDEKKVEMDKEEELVILAEMNIKNFASDLEVNKMMMELNFNEANQDSEYSMKNLRIPPFDSIYLKKGNEEIAGPAIIRRISDGKMSFLFPAFELPITSDEDGDNYQIETTILPFVSDKSTFSIEFNPTSANFFNAKNVDLESLVKVKNTAAISSEEISIQNTVNICIDADGFDGKCNAFLAEIERNKSKDILRKVATDKEGDVVDQGEKNEEMAVKIEELEAEKESYLEPSSSVYELKDNDADGLSNEEEIFLRTDPENKDTDGDGIKDRAEINAGYSPLKTDGQKIFRDLQKVEWAIPYVIKLKLFGVVVNEKLFFPNRNITRADFIQMAVDAFREEALHAVASNPFVDVPRQHESAQQITYAKNMGAIKGYKDNTFKPDDYITRAEAVKILLSLKGIEASATNSDFKDLKDWQIPWVEKAKEIGIVSGYSKIQFKPQNELSRAEAAKIIYSLIWY